MGWGESEARVQPTSQVKARRKRRRGGEEDGEGTGAVGDGPGWVADGEVEEDGREGEEAPGGGEA